MKNQNLIIPEEMTDEKETAKAKIRREFFDQNFAWFQTYSNEIYQNYRGKCVVIAGKELLAADTPEEATALAKLKHPKDEGSFIKYIPKEKRVRIYGNRRQVGFV